MRRRRYTLAVTDPKMIAFLDQKDNVSKYLHSLVEEDIELDHTELARADVLEAILEELQALRQDLGGRAIVTVPDRPAPTGRSTPRGLDRQAGRFREGKRGE